MKALVTGGAGFIGSHFCEELLKRDYEVYCWDDLSNGKEENIEKLFNYPKFRSIIDNCMHQPPDEEEMFKDMDVIFHFAANSDIQKSAENSYIDFKNTLETTHQMLTYCHKWNIKQIVFASTSAVYGNTGNISIVENHGPLRPVSHYGAAKLASEAFINSYSENYNIKSWIIRFPNVIGPGMTHGALYDFINRLKNDNTKLEVLGDGSQYKPYIHVKDLIDAILFIWMNSAAKVNVYNVAPMDGSKTYVKDIAKWTAKEFGCNNIIFGSNPIGWIGDVNTFSYNTSKLEKLGFSMKYSSDQAVQQSIKELVYVDR